MNALRIKTLLFLATLLLAQVSMAQNAGRTTRFYFANKTFGTFRIRTALTPATPISINARTSVLLETDADTLGLLVADEIHRLPFEPGETYYFVVYAAPQSPWVLDEVPERTYWLSASIDNGIKRTAAYFLHKDGRLEQTK